MHYASHAFSGVLFSVSAAMDTMALARDGEALQAIERARPLSVELQQVASGGLAIIIQSRVQESGVPAELRLDLWDRTVEASFSVGGVSHLHVRHMDEAEEGAQVWLSPAMRDEFARGALDRALVFWAIMTEPRVYMEIEGWLSALPPDSLAKNPLCGATKWGLKALAFAANIACCAGGVPACITCTVGLDGVKDAIKGIDCSKECKPDCPIP